MYHAIVVGARCAGSPTAMLLARKGYRVLLVDKATFPSDTMSTHLAHPPGGRALRPWAPAGMLRPARGYAVLRVDKATSPSDTMSTPLAPPPAVAALRRWVREVRRH